MRRDQAEGIGAPHGNSPRRPVAGVEEMKAIVSDPEEATAMTASATATADQRDGGALKESPVLPASRGRAAAGGKLYTGEDGCAFVGRGGVVVGRATARHTGGNRRSDGADGGDGGSKEGRLEEA